MLEALNEVESMVLYILFRRLVGVQDRSHLKLKLLNLLSFIHPLKHKSLLLVKEPSVMLSSFVQGFVRGHIRKTGILQITLEIKNSIL